MATAFQSNAVQNNAFQIEGGVITRPRGWDDAGRRYPILVIEERVEEQKAKPRKAKKRRPPIEHVPEPDFAPIDIAALFPAMQALPPIQIAPIDYTQDAMAAFLRQRAAQQMADEEDAIEMLLLTIN